MKTARISLLVTLLLTVFTALPLHAAPIIQADSTTTNPFLILFPELEQLPAPKWLREGTRVTYATASATIGGESGGAGSGYIQYDVVALDKKNVVSTQSMYLDVNGNGVLSAFPVGPAVEIPGSGSFWVNPTVLADAEQVASDNLSVTRMKEQDNQGNVYNVVRFQYEDERSRTASVMDVESGLLIFFTQTILHQDGTRSEAQQRLAGMRQLKLPWKGRTPPTWVKKGVTLDYVGTQTSAISGVDPIQLPRTYSATVQQVNKRFTVFTTSSSYNNQPEGSSVSVAGVAQLAGLWLPKEALKSKARTGRIDRDPITNVEVRWQFDNNRNLIINEVGPSWESVLTYDGSSGALIAIQITRQSGLATELIELYLQE